ncbi:MAG TPA: nuclear transport factor 2 family protein [Phototrophicaceae bacterium]|jgi:ketosteroid isomerase-like protein|nr:nuclear transport factor 2 family protein [Phototrophicaceae bacterium]
MEQTIITDDVKILEQLNHDYVQSFLKSDAKRYDELIAENFICIEPSGRLFDRAAFLEAATHPTGVEYFHVEDVEIRIFGDFAQITARTPYKLPNGKEGVNRYIDCWIKRDGQWKAISAQITAIAR